MGNQTSQFFANVYLDLLDHFVLRELRPAEYARYVDDVILFSDSKAELHEMKSCIIGHLYTLRLAPRAASRFWGGASRRKASG